MNYLAHCYLSNNDEQTLVGNFIGDFVKGSNHSLYPDKIQQGILLHRKIDSFTDNSEIVKESKRIFSPSYGRYSGIIVAVVYDHFLSTHWTEHSHLPREVFIQNTYNTLHKHYQILPPRAKKLIPSIIYHNWMRYYASFYGLEKVLTRMAKRTSLPAETKECIVILKENYNELDAHFLKFFKELKDYVKEVG